MATITASQVLEFMDKIAAWLLAAKGTSASGLGMGTAAGAYGASEKASDMEVLLMASEDFDLVGPLGASIRGMKNASDATQMGASITSGTFQALGAVCATAGTINELSTVVDLDSFATYYNLTATTKWQCLFPPDLYELMKAALGKAPSAHNTYFEVLQSVSPTALGKLIVGTGFLSPGSIDSAKYAGGFGQVKGVSVSGSATVTVTGSWRKVDGTAATGDGTATVNAGDSTVVLTPPFTSALLLAVTNIAAGTGITAGTIYAEAARPSGRSNPPT